MGRIVDPPTAAACELFQYLAAPTGEALPSDQFSVRLERWETVKSAKVARPDGGMHAVGTMVAPSRSNTFAGYLSPQMQNSLANDADWLPDTTSVVGPIDLIYTWVDGSDPVWLEKRARYASGDRATTDALIKARFESRDELRYSIRSAEMFAGWANRIYLVTDSQVPDWLVTNHPRLKVVDHREIIEASDLPVFNSHAIESRLHHIPGLSEKFVYLNDDVFFGRPVRPDLFFTGAGLTKFFPSKAQIDPGPRSGADVSVTSAAKNNRALIEESFGRTFSRKLKHTPHAHSRTLLFEMEERYPEVFRANIEARFRTVEDYSILSGLAQRYGEATGRTIQGTLRYNYVDVSRPDLPATLARWSRTWDYDAFCLNDTGVHDTTPELVEAAVTQFLNHRFPLPSSFELTDGHGRPTT